MTEPTTEWWIHVVLSENSGWLLVADSKVNRLFYRSQARSPVLTPANATSNRWWTQFNCESGLDTITPGGSVRVSKHFWLFCRSGHQRNHPDSMSAFCRAVRGYIPPKSSNERISHRNRSQMVGPCRPGACDI